MTLTPLITLSNVGCRFKIRAGRFRCKYFNALKDISLTLHKGETLGIIGRNGAGKSTLLKIISGILLPDSGDVTYIQPSVSVSLLSLQLGFSPELSGRLNAIMGAMMLGYSHGEAKKRLDSIVAFSELEDWIDEPLRTYSSGMKARLSFAVAMETGPDVLLVDEVLGVGDEAFRARSSAIIKDKMLSGQTVVFVSHQLSVLRELCTRAVWIEQGVTRMQGDVGQVLDAYKQWMLDRRQTNQVGTTGPSPRVDSGGAP